MIKQYSYIVEAVILFVVIILLGFRLENLGFVGYNFHPFYFVILLITLRYGYWKSIYSMILSCFLYTLFYFLKTSYIGIYDIFGECYHPIAFVAFWMFLGLLVDKDKKKIITLSEEKEQMQKTISFRENEIKKINVMNENISEELVKSSHGFNILFDTTKSLFHEDIMIFYRSAYEVLIKAIETPKAFVFYFEGDSFKLAAPKETKADWTSLISNQKVDDVRKLHKFFRIDMVEEDIASSNEPVFMGPIIHDATDTLFGLIIVEELDFLKYNKNTFRTFKNLCKWLGEILYFRSVQGHEIVHEDNDNEFSYVVKFGSTQQEIRRMVKNAFIE